MAIEPRPVAFGVSRSFSGRIWRLNEAAPAAVRALLEHGAPSQALAQILAARGVEPAQMDDLLHPTLKRLLPEPLTLKDMDIAIARVAGAIEAGEMIAVFGDYDVDGSCSAALMSGYLSAIGPAPLVYIPDRMREGYGPNAAALLQLKAQGAGLVITVDCGATAIDALSAARDAGLDVVVLDHHAAAVPPPAIAQVNPNQPGDQSGLGQLCAAGVTFLFLAGLNRALRQVEFFTRRDVREPDLMAALDLVALATVCDVVPLCGVNRAFVRGGLTRIGARPGLAALCEIAKAVPPYTPYTLGFLLGPRINAGGRVGSCSLGHALLTAPDAASAAPLASQLDRHNRERQAIEQAILDEAMAMAQVAEPGPFLLVAEDGWHPGVAGIVAGRLKERFGRPAFVAGFEGGEGRGSARSVAGIDVGAAVRAAREAGVIGTGGGHAMAAGFSLGKAQLPAFHAFLNAYLKDAAPALDAAQILDLDGAVAAAACTETLAAEIGLAGPFGAGNPEPLLAVGDLTLAYADIVGGAHLRLRLAGRDGTRLDAIAFRSAGTPLGDGLLAARGKPVHLAGRLRAELWNGKARVQLQVEDAAGATL